jgi:replication factor A1
MTISVNDYTAQAWFNVFDDVARKILGVDADTIVESKETDNVKADEVFTATNFSSWVWRVRAQQDNFQGQVRVRYQVVDASPIDYKRENERLVKLIQSYN